MAAIDPAIVVVRHRERVSTANLPGLLEDYDLLVDGSDNFATRYLANDAAELAGKPLVWGSILRFHGQVGVAWKGRGPTFRDLFPAPPPADEALSCELGGVLPSLCTAIGSLVATEVITGEATGGDLGSPKISESPRDGYRWESFANRVGRRPAKERLPDGAGTLITLATQDAVAYHYFPFFSQKIDESFGLRDDGALKAGADLAKAGKIDEALVAWEQVVAADAKSHGAYFDIAVAHVSKGNDEKAAEAIEKAVAIEDSMKYRMLRDAVKGRLALRKTLE